MAGNSLESLLAWMKDTSQLLGWGAIVALERDKTNLLLVQEYITRFNTGSYLPAISGDVPIVENQWMEHLHDFVLDVPRISFENADLNDSRALLSMAIMGGSQITLKREGAQWQAVKVDWFDPLEGPKLYLDLLLNQVPGNVDVDGRILLDLNQSDNFRLTFAQTANEQRLGGGVFQSLFKTLPADKRIYELGQIARGTNDLMQPQSFALRTQANSGAAARDPGSADYGSGAIVALVRMEGSHEGTYPGQDSGFRYLIPDDAAAGYSATVVFDRGRAVMQQLIASVGTMVGSHEFKYEYNDKGELFSAIALGGAVTFAGQNVTKEVWADEQAYTIFGLAYDSFSVPAKNNLIVQREAGGANVRWEYQGAIALRGSIHPHEGTSQTIEYGSIGYHLSIEAVYTVVDDVSAVIMKRTTFDMVLDMVLPPVQDNKAEGELRQVIANWDFKTIIENALNASFPVSVSINEFIQQNIRLNFGQAIQGTTVRAPYDIGFFGRVDPTQTAFVISPLQPLLTQGGTQQFKTEPTVSGVSWSVENLLPSSPGNPGTISASGLYQAPTATSIEGRFTRVRVTATAAGSGYHSSALVTVAVNELTVNPLIQLCDVNTRVELSAGQLGEGALLWSIKNKVEGESGEVVPSDKPDGDHAYVHGPVVATKTYVLDEIEVKTPTGQSRTVHVLALQKPSGLIVSMDTLGLSPGQVQLTASLNGNATPADWSLPLGGPGSIDATGLYQADATATERFVLIFAAVEVGIFGKFEGHMIVPLPLIEFPDVLQTLSQ